MYTMPWYLSLGGGRKKPIPPEDKSRAQLIHEAKEWRKCAGNWRAECMEEKRMFHHELEVRTRSLVLFWLLMLVFCVGCWSAILWLVAWLAWISA